LALDLVVNGPARFLMINATHISNSWKIASAAPIHQHHEACAWFALRTPSGVLRERGLSSDRRRGS
jgi:hypothetical protein